VLVRIELLQQFIGLFELLAQLVVEQLVADFDHVGTTVGLTSLTCYMLLQ